MQSPAIEGSCHEVLRGRALSQKFEAVQLQARLLEQGGSKLNLGQSASKPLAN